MTNRLGEPRRTFIPLVLKTVSGYLISDEGRRGECLSPTQPCGIVLAPRPLVAELPGCLLKIQILGSCHRSTTSVYLGLEPYNLAFFFLTKPPKWFLCPLRFENHRKTCFESLVGLTEGKTTELISTRSFQLLQNYVPPSRKSFV